MLFCSSAPVVVPVVGLSVPIMWLYLLGNTITQYPVTRSLIFVTQTSGRIYLKFFSLFFFFLAFN